MELFEHFMVVKKILNAMTVTGVNNRLNTIIK